MARRLHGGLLTGLLAVVLSGCASSSQTVTGTPRPPISPEEVRVYTKAPANFEQIAVLSASRRTIRSGGEGAIAHMIESLRERAAALGANGLLLDDFFDAGALSLSAGAGTESYTHNGSIDVGVGSSVGVVKKMAKGRAIYVPAVNRD